jgi:hypothetical protein
MVIWETSSPGKQKAGKKIQKRVKKMQDTSQAGDRAREVWTLYPMVNSMVTQKWGLHLVSAPSTPWEPGVRKGQILMQSQKVE